MDSEITVMYANIQALCEKKGITVGQLEKNAGVPQGSASNWRVERRWMKHIPAIARELNVSIDQLFRLDYQMLEEQNIQTPFTKVMRSLESLDFDDDTADLIIGIAKLLTEKRVR